MGTRALRLTGQGAGSHGTDIGRLVGQRSAVGSYVRMTGDDLGGDSGGARHLDDTCTVPRAGGHASTSSERRSRRSQTRVSTVATTATSTTTHAPRRCITCWPSPWARSTELDLDDSEAEESPVGAPTALTPTCSGMGVIPTCRAKTFPPRMAITIAATAHHAASRPRPADTSGGSTDDAMPAAVPSGSMSTPADALLCPSRPDNAERPDPRLRWPGAIPPGVAGEGFEGKPTDLQSEARRLLTSLGRCLRASFDTHWTHGSLCDASASRLAARGTIAFQVAEAMSATVHNGGVSAQIWAGKPRRMTAKVRPSLLANWRCRCCSLATRGETHGTAPGGRYPLARCSTSLGVRPRPSDREMAVEGALGGPGDWEARLARSLFWLSPAPSVANRAWLGVDTATLS